MRSGDMAIILARMAAMRAAGVKGYRVEVRRVGCDGPIVREFVTRGEALEEFARQRWNHPDDLTRLELSERVDDGWVARSSSVVAVEARARDLEVRRRRAGVTR